MCHRPGRPEHPVVVAPGTDLTNRFPEIAVAAAAQIPAGTVIDGEVVIWNEDRLDFDLLQRRLVSGVARIRELVKTHQASFVAFDLLAAAGTDLRTQPWRSRRAALERVARWEPPLQLSPTTEDTSVARAWMADYRPAGIEGLVVKGVTTRYTPGKRNWIKVKSRATHEVIVGAVIGPLARPETVVAGLFPSPRLSHSPSPRSSSPLPLSIPGPARSDRAVSVGPDPRRP